VKEAYSSLADALVRQGQFVEAIATYKKASELDPKDGEIKSNLTGAERMRELLPRLSDVLNGRGEPKNPGETCEFARLCTQPFQKRYEDAVRLFEKAFAADPKLADDLAAGDRYRAACSAALASAGKDANGAKLDDKERARLRRKAFEWLRADLDLRKRLLASGNLALRAPVAQALINWRIDPDLDGLRDTKALAKLPVDEEKAFAQLWTDAAALLKDAEAKPN
jgi:pentatricopeptide repeat protein